MWVFLEEKSLYVVPSLFRLAAFAEKDAHLVEQHEEADIGHLAFVQVFPVICPYKDRFRLRMVHDMMNIVRFEIIEDRYRDRSISQDTEKDNPPM